MGPQPWPKGQSRLVAIELGINPTALGSAVSELMRRGVFKPQVDGVLYVPEINKLESTSTNGGRKQS
jgi:hypothetical protein